MAKLYIINSKTRVITNIVEADNNYEPPNGREIAKGSGKVGEVIRYRQPAKKTRLNTND